MNSVDYKKAKFKDGLLKTIIYIFLGVWAIIVLFPFYWMILTSLKSYGTYNGEYIPKFFVSNPTLENYTQAFTAVPLARYFLNTLIFTVVTTALMLIVVVLAAYAFARLDFKGKNFTFTAFLSLMMIPNELVIITNFVTITNLGLRNTFTGLILPSVTSVFYIYLLKENFQQIPDSLYKAAKVDGTSDLKYLFKVMIPICKPTIVTVIILKVDFEYSVSGNELEIAKVVALRKRKTMCKVQINEIERLEKDDTEIKKMRFLKTFIAARDIDSKDENYFAVFNSPAYGRCLLVFTPNEDILNGMKPHLNKNIVVQLFYKRKMS